MKIISINLCSWGDGENSIPQRMPRALWLIRKYSPDIFGVQEATPEWMECLKTNLTEYSSVGIGRDENGEGEASSIFYKNGTFELIKEDFFWLSETPEQISLGWDAACRRICTMALLKNKTTGSRFAFFNTHLDHIGPVAQKNGAALINSRIQEYAGKCPVILTGDFNVSYDSEAYAEIKLNDARVVAEEADAGRTWHNFGGETDEYFAGMPIDICFISDDVKVKSYTILRDKCDDKFITDHYPILVETT